MALFLDNPIRDTGSPVETIVALLGASRAKLAELASSCPDCADWATGIQFFGNRCQWIPLYVSWKDRVGDRQWSEVIDRANLVSIEQRFDQIRQQLQITDKLRIYRTNTVGDAQFALVELVDDAGTFLTAVANGVRRVFSILEQNSNIDEGDLRREADKALGPLLDEMAMFEINKARELTIDELRSDGEWELEEHGPRFGKESIIAAAGRAYLDAYEEDGTIIVKFPSLRDVEKV